MNADLNGKRALVGGASQGIGRSTALALAESGAKVIAMARSRDKLESLVAELPGDGHKVLALDIADRDKLSSELDKIISEVGAIEILICNSGGPKGGPIADVDEETFVQSFANHVLVNSLMVKKLLPGMKEKKYGRVINIISTSVKVPIPNLGASNTIRGAVANWAKTLSMEVAPFGITVNNVLPGFTDTPRLAALIEGAAGKAGKSVEEMTEIWKGRVPMARFAKPEETAAAIHFLASPMAGYISGINLPVDGGRTVCL